MAKSYNMKKNTDYRSPLFYKIIAVINSTLTVFKLNQISADTGKISASLYNKGAYGTTVMWRITNYMFPELLNQPLMYAIKDKLTEEFPELVQDKIIVVGLPTSTRDRKGYKMSSVVIMLGELPDNIITKEVADKVKSGDKEVLVELLELESRMLRYENDKRDPVTRVFDMIDALYYEPNLTKSDLKDIKNLALNHQVKVITMETDKKTDFIGEVRGRSCRIEGKSTRAYLTYTEDAQGRSDFANMFERRRESGSLGSLHNADYVLFVLKQTGEVICINTKKPLDNWFAGYLYKEE